MLRSPNNKSKLDPDLPVINEPGTNVTRTKRKQPSLSSELKKSILDLQAGMAVEFFNVKTSKLTEEFNTLSTNSTQIKKRYLGITHIIYDYEE